MAKKKKQGKAQCQVRKLCHSNRNVREKPLVETDDRKIVILYQNSGEVLRIRLLRKARTSSKDGNGNRIKVIGAIVLVIVILGWMRRDDPPFPEIISLFRAVTYVIQFLAGIQYF